MNINYHMTKKKKKTSTTISTLLAVITTQSFSSFSNQPSSPNSELPSRITITCEPPLRNHLHHEPHTVVSPFTTNRLGSKPETTAISMNSDYHCELPPSPLTPVSAPLCRPLPSLPPSHPWPPFSKLKTDPSPFCLSPNA